MTTINTDEDLAKVIDNSETNFTVEDNILITICHFATQQQSNHNIDDVIEFLLDGLADQSERHNEEVETKVMILASLVDYLAEEMSAMLKEKEVTLEMDADKSEELSKFVYKISPITQ